jgi:hypothetical protein
MFLMLLICGVFFVKFYSNLGFDGIIEIKLENERNFIKIVGLSSKPI